MNVIRRCRRGLILFVAMLMGTVGLMVFGPVGSVSAGVSTPSWWNGACDVNNNAGSYALGASYDGVQACGPGSYNQGGTDKVVYFYTKPTKAWGEYEWECTELVMRYMYLMYGVVPYAAVGSTVVGNYSGSVLASVSNDGTSLPSPGDIISFAGVKANPNGHTAVVTAVNVTDGSGKVTIMEQNATSDGWGTLMVSGGKITTTVLGGAATGWLHSSSTSSGGGSPPSSTPQILSLKRTTDPNGVRQVYAATNTAVTEGWWIPGGDGVHTHTIVTIAQHDVVGFDKVNLPGGTQAVYTAEPDGVWESWWKPDGTNGSSKIVQGLSGVKGVIAYNDTESGVFVHHLYILAGDGPHEAWWKDGGDGVHVSLLTSIAGPVTFTMLLPSDGTMHLYVAVPTWVYDVWWHPGLNDIQVRAIINIGQGDIRAVTADTFQATGLLLYTMTSTSVWQSYWTPGSSIETHAAVTGQVNTVGVKKTNYGDSHQLYLATRDHVQEYWWKDNGASGGGELIRVAQNNIGAIDKVADGSYQDLYTGAGNWVYETYWGNGVSPTTSGLFSVAN